MELCPRASEVPLPGFCRARSRTPSFGASPPAASTRHHWSHGEAEPSRWEAAEQLVHAMFTLPANSGNSQVSWLDNGASPVPSWLATPSPSGLPSMTNNELSSNRAARAIRANPNAEDRVPTWAQRHSVGIARPARYPIDSATLASRDALRFQDGLHTGGSPEVHSRSSDSLPFARAQPRTHRPHRLGSPSARRTDTAEAVLVRSFSSGPAARRLVYSDDAARRPCSLDAVTAVVAFTGSQKSSTDSSADHCSICLEDFEKGSLLRVLPCMHRYHMACVDPWLQQHHSECPLCRHRAV